MTKTETLQRLTAAANAVHLKELQQQIETLRQAQIESAEELASVLLPLAEAMATLTDESSQALVAIEKAGVETVQRYQMQFAVAEKALVDGAMLAQRAAQDLDAAASWTEWHHYLLAIATGAMSGLLVSVFWLWLVPSVITR